MNSAGFIALDNGCRGAAAGLLLMMAAVFLRHRPPEFIRAALAGAGAASAIIEAPGFPSQWYWASLPLIMLSSAGPVAFWLWARVVFDDDFVFRPWHGATAIAAIGLGLANSYCAETSSARAMNQMLMFVNLGFGMLAIANAIGLCVLGVLAGWHLFRTAALHQASALEAAVASAGQASSAPIRNSNQPEVEPQLLNRLERLMTVERAYRREGLTIGALAALASLPEYRLRQVINEGLGYRNFNAFLNRYRIEEVKAALADPDQKDVPVLTIAMDAGFQSLGPFNRAFKAETGVTPTEFRRQALLQNPTGPRSEARNLTIGKSH